MNIPRIPHPLAAGLRRALVLLFVLLVLPHAAQAYDDDEKAVSVEIRSQAEWKKFIKKYSDVLVDVKLYCDLDFDKDGLSMKKFRGTFDGQGHTFRFDYKYTFGSSAPFLQAEGTIKNLYLTGDIEYRYGWATYTESVPLVRKVEMYWHGLTVRNCHCDVRFKEVSTQSVWEGWNNSYIGGFISTVKGATVNFYDCSFTGSFEMTKLKNWHTTGGFVGLATWYSTNMKDASINMYNCFCKLTFKGDAKPYDEQVGYVVGHIDSGTNFGLESYYLYLQSNMSGFDNIYPNAKIVTDAQLASGEVTYGLSHNPDHYNLRTGDDNPWRQTIGVDALPRPKFVSPSSKEVVYTEGTTRAAQSSDWGTLFYPANVSLPDGVSKYVVTGSADKRLQLSLLKSSRTADTPLLLYKEGGIPELTLPACYYNKATQNRVLRGTYADYASSASTDYVLDGEQKKFVPAASSTVPAWTCYASADLGDGCSIGGVTPGTIISIASNDDWNQFAADYGGVDVTVYLANDLTLTPEDQAVANFQGTFDGQGHKLTLDFSTTTSSDNCGYAFKTMQGTFKNLILTQPEDAASPKNVLAYGTSGAVSFDDCVIGAPIAYILYNKATFTNSCCPQDYGWYRNGGSGWAIAHTNCYLWNDTGTSTTAGVTRVTDDQVASGEVAYRLNAGRTGDNLVWRQTIGEDDEPQLLKTSSQEVLHAAASTRAATDAKWTTLYYPADVTLSTEGTLRVFNEFASDDEEEKLYAYQSMTNTLPARTPAVLYCADGLPAINLPEAYYNANEAQDAEGLLGTCAETAASDLYTLAIAEYESAAFTKGAQETLPAWQVYTNMPLTVADDGLFIHSQEEWNTFKTRYSGSTVNAALLCDLTLTAEDTPMQEFKGTFNGTLQTITLDGAAAPFAKAEGSIERLNIVGTPATDSPALVGAASAALTIKDCRSEAGYFAPVKTEEPETPATPATLAEEGEDPTEPTEPEAEDLVTYQNCLVVGTEKTEAYVGETQKAAVMTEEQLSQGIATYLLNNGRTGNEAIWGQTIGTDGLPLLNTTSPEVHIAATKLTIGTAGWATHYYPLAQSLPEGVHAYTVTGVAEEDGAHVVQLQEISEIIPAYTPVLLCSLSEGASEAEKTITIDLPPSYYNTLSDPTIDPEQTYRLVGVTVPTVTFDGCYVLQRQTDAETGEKLTAFYRVDERVSTPTVPAWKCMLCYKKSSASGTAAQQRVRLSPDDGSTTAIDAAPTVDPAAQAISGILADGPTYDLSGRAVKTLKKGEVYVKNGQKFVVR